MKKRIYAFLLALTVLFSTALLAACGNESEPVAGDAAYSVTILGVDGKPAAGVIVKFMQNGKQIAMQPVDANGVATKTLPKGDYTIELAYTDDKAIGYFDPATGVLSAEKTSTQIALLNAVSGEGVDLGVDGETVKAYNVVAGSTYINVTKGVRNYFLFAPTQAGTYQFSIDNAQMKLGYYGSPFFVQANSVAEVTNNTLKVSISQSMIGTGDTGTTILVLGVDGAEADGSCILQIQRIGDPEYNISDEPWTPYNTTHTPAPFTLNLASGKELTYVDITGTTADNQVIYNEADGYYHFGTADGPVVYVHLGKNAPYVSLQVVIQGDGAMGGAPIRRYFFAENGDFLKKEDYTDILSAYFANMDAERNVYPLTKDLEYIIKNACSKWWETGSQDKMPAFDGCNAEIAWMFALCYAA